MKAFMNAEINVEKFNVEDIITASGGGNGNESGDTPED